MGEPPIRHTDLGPEEPGDRANPRVELDQVDLRAELPGARFAFRGRAGTRSRLQSAMETVSVAFAWCVTAGTMSAIGAPKWVAISALPLLLGYNLCTQWLFRRKQCESCRRGGSGDGDPGD